jgi:hypothetical protein
LREQPAEQGSGIGIERQVQLRAAADALRTWVNDQRAGWADRPPIEHPVIVPILPVEPVPSPPAAWTPVVTPIELPPVEPEPPLFVTSAAEPSVQTTAAVEEEESRDWSSLVRKALGSVLALALMAVVGFGALKVRAYFVNRPPDAPATGTAILESVPSGSELFVDGEPAGKTPVTMPLAAGTHRIEFRRRSSSRKLTIDVPAGKSVREQLDWTAKRKGSLEVLSDPEGAAVTVDGAPRGVTPLTIDDLTAGSHTVVLESSGGTVKRVVSVAADRVAQITEAIYSGWLHVSTPFEVRISDEGRGVPLDERNQALLPAGSHSLQFDNAPLGYHERRTVTIKPGAITSIELTPPTSPLTVNASLPAEVLVDGVRIGDTPIVDRAIELGTRVIVVRSITGAERRYTLPVTASQPVSIAVDFSRP